MIEVNQGILAPKEPRPKTVRAKKLADFPGVPKVYLDVAGKLSSVWRMGPPICDELMAFVQHLFTEEEATVVRHLGTLGGMTAAQVATAEHRPVDEIGPILDRLATVKRAICLQRRRPQRGSTA